MSILSFRLPICAAAVLLVAAPHVAYAQGDTLLGTWRNPKNTVHVRTEPCGNLVCGVVVWASDAARADAKRGGTGDLIGTTVFRNFKQEKPNVWRGKVYAPDVRMTFSGTLTVDNNELRGKGCLIGGIGCKTRTWERVSD